MRSKFILVFIVLIAGHSYSQNNLNSETVVKPKFISTGIVMQDLQQNGTNSKYYETSQDLIFMDENLIGALNAITPNVVTQENIDYIKYINSRDQKPYREVWDHNIYFKYATTITDVQQILTDPAVFADLKKRLGREFNRLDVNVFITGSDRIMFILRSPNSQAGAFYRAILGNGEIRIDEISNWRDS